MATCSSGQLPWSVLMNGAYYTGNNAAEACAAAGIQGKQDFGQPSLNGIVMGNGRCGMFYPGSDGDYNYPVSEVCTIDGQPTEPSTPTTGNVIQCGQACTVTVSLTPAQADPANLADLSVMAGLFTVAAIVIFCARKLYDFFDKAPHGD